MSHTFHTSISDERRQHVERMGDLARDIINGRIPDTPLPWQDETFQKFILRGISELRRFEDAQRKLDVLKEVFGGK